MNTSNSNLPATTVRSILSIGHSPTDSSEGLKSPAEDSYSLHLREGNRHINASEFLQKAVDSGIDFDFENDTLLLNATSSRESIVVNGRPFPFIGLDLRTSTLSPPSNLRSDASEWNLYVGAVAAIVAVVAVFTCVTLIFRAARKLRKTYPDQRLRQTRLPTYEECERRPQAYRRVQRRNSATFTEAEIPPPTYESVAETSFTSQPGAIFMKVNKANANQPVRPFSQKLSSQEFQLITIGTEHSMLRQLPLVEVHDCGCGHSNPTMAADGADASSAVCSDIPQQQ